MESVTTSELLDALLAATAGDGPDDARTVQDLVAASGLSRDRVRMALHRLAQQGRLGTHRVRRLDLAGRVQWTPAYTVRPA